MPLPTTTTPGAPADIIVVLDELRQFAGPPAEFWPKFAAVVQRLTEAAEVHFLIGHPEPAAGWQPVAALPLDAGRTSATTPEAREQLAARATAEGGVVVAKGAGVVWLAAGFRVEGDAQVAAVVVRLAQADPPWVNEARLRLGLVAHTPNLYQASRVLRQVQEDSAHAAGALDLLLLVNAQKKFLGAAMVLCNELAARFRCQRVSLGWFDHRYTRLKAISHMERFEKRMDAVARIEAAMDESVDQDEEILFPTPPGTLTITRDHELYAAHEKAAHLLTLPLRIEGRPIAAITLERDAEAFSDAEIRGIRVIADQVAPRLSEVHESDRWWGARLWRRTRRGAARLLEPEHAGLKITGIAGAAVVATLILGSWPYKVEAPFLVRTESLLHVSAPFDSYLEEVLVNPGDHVPAGGPLLRLDARKLIIDEAAAVADVQRFDSEAEKAQSLDNAADMRVAQAQAEQARAALQLTRYRLGQAEVRSPFEGVVIEGDLRERIGAPVRQGDALFKIARLDGLYAELKVPERSIHEVQPGARGELAFVSRPDARFPFTVERIEPSALAERGGNSFLVRCRFDQAPADWWRPGMSGLAKVHIEPRPLWWVLSHRAIDFLRMKLWW
jgi:biotin carboxyl carrier protein